MKLLDCMGEDPIELCHFETMLEDAERESLNFVTHYRDVFQGHCASCFSLTQNNAAWGLADKYWFTDISEMLEPWQELAQIYLDADFPVYLSENYFEVYRKLRVVKGAKYQSFFISGCLEHHGEVVRVEEQGLSDEDAEFFTVYGKDANGLSWAINDFPNRPKAEAYMSKL
ncbi:hypothetical protein [Hydrogenovibrio marinus]|uniref:Uncharacterized protein n=1 Tax=Hydrogenovibrio marinus TaxID=28885 RepID=A0A066ZWB4_HYDMR|nr:hypothetical protein [Hydrogenovibrio marinus]KDN94631.1 hypothetical protein EI16_12070 [Hydrogenovibrio marinus]